MNLVQSSNFYKSLFVSLLMLAIFFVSADAATAGGGGGLPYEEPLKKIGDSITGPVAYWVSVIGFVAAGAGLIFGGAELNMFFRSLVWLVLIVCIIVFAKNTLTTVTGVGAMLDSGVDLKTLMNIAK